MCAIAWIEWLVASYANRYKYFSVAIRREITSLNVTPGKFGLMCVLLAVALPLGWGAAESFLLKSVEVQLPSTVGPLAPIEFPVRQSGAYEIAIRINRPHGSDTANQRAECLLGTTWERDRAQCGGTSPVIDVTWHLRALDGSPLYDTIGTPVNTGREREWSPVSTSGYDIVQRPLVGFEGVRGKRYSLHLESMSDLTALEEFRPRVVVGPAGSMLETVMVRDIPVFVVAALICIVGLIALGVGVVVRIREWRLG